jgi:ATP-dependent exoDNAse (exonuclease V) alpha subunit
VRAGDDLPLDQKARFQVFHSRELKLAAGDQIRITRNGFSLDGKHRLDNGTLWTITGFDEAGNIRLENGWTISKDYGFIDHGHVVTSYSSQGKTVQRVLLAQGYESLPASSREQFYVSTSRAKEQVTIYTGNRQELLAAVSEGDERLMGLELMPATYLPVLAAERQRPESPSVQKSRELVYER